MRRVEHNTKGEGNVESTRVIAQAEFEVTDILGLLGAVVAGVSVSAVPTPLPCLKVSCDALTVLSDGAFKDAMFSFFSLGLFESIKLSGGGAAS